LIEYLLIITILLLLYIAYRVTTTYSMQPARLNSSLVEFENRVANRISRVEEILADIKNTSHSINQLGYDLREILSSERRRGQLGEILIENILQDVLPPSCYQRQVPLNGGRVDYVIKTRDFLIPLDSKFPYENYKTMLQGDGKARDAFLKNVRSHIDAVSQYVAPEEGTSDYALMYIPLESMYLHIIEDVATTRHAFEKKVLLTSPLTLHYILHSINETIKREQLPEILEQLYREILELKNALNVFEQEFAVLENHIKNAYKKTGETRGRLNKLCDSADRLVLERIDELK
jgi:DNA recombination protein RmuC